MAKLFSTTGFIGEVEVPNGTTAVVIQDSGKHNGVYSRGAGKDMKEYFYWRNTHYTKLP